MKLNLNRLKAERIARGMSQDDMVDRLGWSSRSSYSKRENGKIDIGVNEFLKIMDILECKDISIFFENQVPEKERNN